MNLYFDIETEPLPEDELRQLCPPFDPAEVKVGNLGPAKAAEKIAEAEANHFANFCEKAALSAFTGHVVAIGALTVEGSVQEKVELIDCAAHEASGIGRFWGMVANLKGELIGFNSHGFDIPFLIRRSWYHRLPMPACMRLDKDRYWPEWNVDLMKRFMLGDLQGRAGLDRIAKFFGLQGKTGDHGHEFGKLWRDPQTRALAEDYLRRDVMECYELDQVMVFAPRPDCKPTWDPCAGIGDPL